MDRKRLIIAVPQSRCGSTFLMRVLNGHPQICLTNESRLYRLRFWPCHFLQALEQIGRYPIAKDAGVEALRREFRLVAKDYPDIPLRHRDRELSAHCIRAVENALFGKNRKGFIGDKGYLPLSPPAHDRAMSIEEATGLLPMKVVFLYRDPRDMLTSIARTSRRYVEKYGYLPAAHPNRWDRNPPWHPTRSENPYRQSLEWAQVMARWEDIKADLSFLEIQYERLMDGPDTVLHKVADFLELDNAKPMQAEFRRRVAHRDHIGYWKRVCPDIQEKMHPDVFPIMRRLGYEDS